MAENGVRPPDPPPNGHRQDGQHNGHRDTPIARQDDVFLDIPKLQVDKIELDVDNLRARVSLNAEVLSLLRLNVGVDAAIDQVHLGIAGVEAQAQLKVRLENVAHIIDSVLGTINAHPEIIQPLVENAGKAIGAAGRGIESAVTDTGQAVREIGGGTGHAVRDVGGGAGEAVRDVGGGAGQATRDVGAGAGRATGEVVGGAAGNVGATAGEATGQVGATREAGKQVTDHAAEAETEGGDQPDISAQSTVAADREEQRDTVKRPPRRAGLPRRKPRTW